jgi:hypothetical protein
MIINLTAAARVVPLTALMLGACVSQSAYEKQGQELQAARAQAATEQSQIAKMQAAPCTFLVFPGAAVAGAICCR